MKKVFTHSTFTCILSFLLSTVLSAQANEIYLPQGVIGIPITHTAKVTSSVGDWNVASTWVENSIPGDGAVVLIPENVIVSLKGYETNKIKFLSVKGRLQIPSYWDITIPKTILNIETIWIESSGKFFIGSNVTPVNSTKQVEINFITLPSSSNPSCAWNFNLAWDPKKISRGLISFGDAEIRIYGQYKTSKEIINDVTLNGINDTTIVLNNMIENWKHDDDLVIPGTVFERKEIYDDMEDELFSIHSNTDLTTTTILLDHNFENNHMRTNSSFDLHVANLTRNVIFKTEQPALNSLPIYNYTITDEYELPELPFNPPINNPFETSNFECILNNKTDFDQDGSNKRRGHIMFTGKGNVIIKSVLFKGLGRTNKAIPLDDVNVSVSIQYNEVIEDNNGLQDTTITPIATSTVNNDILPYNINNNRGRYAVHFHQNNYSFDKSELENDLIGNNVHSEVYNCVVWGTPGWGFVNHSSFVKMNDNVCYDFTGAGFVTESGDEFGSFTNNIAIRGIGDGKYHPLKQSLNNLDRLLPLSDFGFAGDGFWFQGPMISVKNNVAANCNGAGMIWFALGSPEPLGSPQNAEHEFIGIDRALAVAAYTNYKDENDNPLVTLVNNNQFSPRHWDINGDGILNQDTDNDISKTDEKVILSDLPLLECDSFQAYGCLAGFRVRFCNAPILALFLDKYPYSSTCIPSSGITCTDTESTNLFGYRNIIIPAEGVCFHEKFFETDNETFNIINANRLAQTITNLKLWNNEIGLRVKYTTETLFDTILIDNRLTHKELNGSETDYYPGLSAFDGAEHLVFKNTEISGYALSAQCVLDVPTPSCNIYPANFNATSNDIVNHSVSGQFDNTSIDCPSLIPTISNNILTFHPDTITNRSINRIGLRYKSVNDIYWNYIWQEVSSTNNQITLPNLPQGNYEYQVVSGCLLDTPTGPNHYFDGYISKCNFFGNKTFDPNEQGFDATLETSPQDQNYINTLPYDTLCNIVVGNAMGNVNAFAPDTVASTSNWSSLDFFQTRLLNNSSSEINQLTIYPNPTNQNTLNLSFQTKVANKTFSISDMSGKVLKIQEFNTNEGENLLQIDISNLPAGIYFISDRDGLNAKFVVM